MQHKFWKTEQRKKARNKKKEGTSNPSPKKAVLWKKQPEQVKKKVTTQIQILMLTYRNGVKQAVAEKKISECVSVGEKLMLKFYTRKWKESEVKWKRLK